MKKLYIWSVIAAFAALTLSCSAALQRRYDQRHGVSSSTSTASTDRSSSGPEDSRNSQTTDPTYRKDYDRVVDGNGSTGGTTTSVSGNAGYNQQLLNQYTDMDKLAEVVLYELDNLENRYNNLLNEYKNAKSSSRQVMAMELDKISDDRLALYKAYTNIYRNGKTDWAAVKRDVDNTLREYRKKN
ncbi:hypothetical protein SAMN05216327_106306 [Dyadobacter sp. SG02]|uniref:hypothetical protein n=1 Tax=Dyadobacter sp. SG02 TaxID=1855291 RepID=UPI0008BC8018|nr:hypothetical protein [Dyadobacter sp. SG02]SEJ14309.1 hypothetical protein SAMN05216327_106306 [Dyadobacter sp. SG02]